MSSDEERKSLVESSGTYYYTKPQYAATATTDLGPRRVTPGRRSTRLSIALERSDTHDISLSWKDICVTVNIPGKKALFGGETRKAEEKLILDKITGVANPGSLIAIMGASGSGKSTLLNVLTSRNIKDYNISGSVMLNGCPLTEKAIRNISAYVQQHDLFISTLTVREQLQFRALLRMDKKLGKFARMRRVEQVIDEMGLQGCSTSRIGDAHGSKKSISGGERKRLAFACEALPNPPIFFCDEPTSSLDSFMAQSIVKTLGKMAGRGHSILCTIHQPSSEIFSLFNQVVLLSKGRLAFMGTREDALAFFNRMNYPCPNNFNPADHYILTLAIAPGKEEECIERGNAICDAFKDTVHFKTIESEIDDAMTTNTAADIIMLRDITNDSRYDSSIVTQLSQLFWRAWVTQLREPRLTGVRIMQAAIVGLVLSLVYFQLDTDQKGVQNIAGSLFLVIVFTSFSNMFSALTVFCDDIPIIMREYGSSLYRIDTYYLAKSCAEIPMVAFVATLFVSMTYWMIGYDDAFDKYLIAVITNIACALASIGMSYIISTACVKSELALSVASPIFTPFMLFTGILINTDDIPDYFIPLEKISWMGYGYEIVMGEQWKDVKQIDCPNATITNPNATLPEICATRQCLFNSGDAVLDYYSMDDDVTGENMAIIGGIALGFYLTAFLILSWRSKHSKE